MNDFLITCFLISTKLKDHNLDYEELRTEFSGIMKEHFELDLYNKSFGNEDRFSGSVTLQKMIQFVAYDCQ